MKQKFTLVLFIVLSCLSKFNTAKAQVNVQDSLELVNLYTSTNGPGWSNHTNWLTGAPVSSWYGISVANNKVTEIYLPGNNLSGSLPFTFYKLSALSYLEISNNKLTGEVPHSIDSLKNMMFLFLNDNQLSGTTTDWLGYFPKLQATNLSDNKFSGNIPFSLGNYSTNLTVLELDNNNFSGSIPSTFNKLGKLQLFTASGNQLTGRIDVLANLNNLETVVLSYNQFSGKLPIFNSTKFNYFSLSHNQFSGSIPKFRSCSALSYLALDQNLLSGNLNHQFDSLSNLDLGIYLAHNQLSGSLPSFKKMTNLQVLDLSFNHFSGIIPAFDSLKNLNYLNISNNQLTFAGMEKVIYEFSTTTYAPQATIHLNKTGNKFSVSAGGTLSNNTYNWYRYGKLFKTTIADSIIYVGSNGNYSVKVTNSVATALTLQSDTINYTIGTNMIAATQQNFQKNSSILIYPNPTKTTATILFKAEGKYTITVADVSGKILQTKKDVLVKGINTIPLNLNKYLNGIYFITISNEKDFKQTFELFKQ